LGLPRNNKDKKEIPYIIDVFKKDGETVPRGDFGWDEPGYVAKVRIDKEILTTRDGIIWVLLDKDLIPIKGVLKDAVGFGDVVGKRDRVEPQ
jgi:hypothetical protein